MIVVTGAAGFIGSCLIAELNAHGYTDVVAVDDFSRSDKEPNMARKRIARKVHRDEFATWLGENHKLVYFVFHIGARTDTTEFDTQIFNKLNLHYSMRVWELCAEHGIPLVYASSAATYGMGEHGYSDAHEVVPNLAPLNPYGVSKNDFDKWALTRDRAPYFWAGLKFFNVYGPNEYHKGRMASVIFHAYNQIKERGYVKLFRSHHPQYADGGQLRDFVYVKDVVSVCMWLMEHRGPSGLFNLGTGTARTFNHLAEATFQALGLSPNVEYIDTPLDIRDKYQYYTQADMLKIRSAGYNKAFYTLEHGVYDYVAQYLEGHRYM